MRRKRKRKKKKEKKKKKKERKKKKKKRKKRKKGRKKRKKKEKKKKRKKEKKKKAEEVKKAKIDEILDHNGVSVIANQYVDYFFGFLQRFFGELSFFKQIILASPDSVSWHFQKYSIMSLCARSFGDSMSADQYLQ